MTKVPTRMRAIGISKPGGPEVLESIECETPRPGPGEVLVQVQCAGVNRPDCLQRAGLYRVPDDASPLPGLEIAGAVVAVGSDSGRWKIGDRVVALTHGGGYAEYCRVHAQHCLPWPGDLPAAEAACLPETTFTVWHNLCQRARLEAGERVLIHGGSSGIGSTAIQIAKNLGAVVYTTAGSEEKLAFCRELGADRAINYREEDWPAVVMEASAGAGVDVVLDMVAGSYVAKNLGVLALDGRYAMIAFLGGPKAEVNFAVVLTRRLTITGSTLRPQTVVQKAAIAAAVEARVWPLVTSGRLQVPIAARFPLAEAAAAHTLMESSRHMGKIVLEVND